MEREHPGGWPGLSISAAQLVQIVRAIDRAGPAPANSGSAADRSAATHQTKALIRARAALVQAYNSATTDPPDTLPMALPWVPPWKQERLFGERTVMWEPEILERKTT